MNHRRAAGMASASMGSMAVQAAASLGLQAVAAVSLGAAGYGRFAIILGGLAVLTVVQMSIGDGLIVLALDRAQLRGAVLGSQLGAAVIGTLLAVVIGLVSGIVDPVGVCWLGVMVAMWNLEEMGRRHLIRDQLFTSLLVNDLVYGAAAFTSLGMMRLASGGLELSSFLVAMATGASVSFLVSIVQLPRGTYNLRQVSVTGLRDILTFAGWRAAQSGVRPLALMLSRIIIVGVTSAALLGRLEAARLLVQPIWVLVSGLGSFLLTEFSTSGERGRRLRSKMGAGVALIGAITTTWTLAVVGLADLVQPLVVGDEYPVDRVSLAAWGAFYVVTAIGFPASLLLVACKAARTAFFIRAVDGLLSLSLVGIAASAFGARWAPMGMAAGALLGTVMMWRNASRRVPAPPTSPAATLTRSPAVSSPV